MYLTCFVDWCHENIAIAICYVSESPTILYVGDNAGQLPSALSSYSLSLNSEQANRIRARSIRLSGTTYADPETGEGGGRENQSKSAYGS